MWDFDIQNGVLIGYSGELPNELHIPEDVSIIAKVCFEVCLYKSYTYLEQLKTPPIAAPMIRFQKSLLGSVYFSGLFRQ